MTRSNRAPALSRRGFLMGSVALGLGASGPALARASLSADCGWCLPGEAAWRDLADRSHGQVLRPGEAGFLERAAPQNLRYRRVSPQAIARCGSPEIVAAVIDWCRGLDMPFAIRGGGHSYAGHSTSAGILIDLSPMNRIDVDAATGAVDIEAGARNADIARALEKSGRTITHGRCGTVGIAGFLLGGGIGFNMRRYGIGSDLMRAAELVTADGRVRHVSEGSEPDLFWALRGGAGGNFGVATRFTLASHPADERITVFSLRWNTQSEAVAQAFVAAAEKAPESFASRFSLGAASPEQRRAGIDVHFDLLGQHAGPKGELLDLLAPVFGVARPERLVVEERSYWAGQDFLAEPGEPGFYQERSGFVRQRLDERILECGFRRLRDWPGTAVGADLRFFQTGGAINRMAPDATAFVHRDSAWLFSIGLDWSAGDQATPEVIAPAQRWQDGFYREMRELCGSGAYQNFPDPSLVDWRKAYYGANLARLEKIKADIDPFNLFRHGQSL
ncbi:FAD-binding oxidoreductase [Bosea sp. (in: a-proteobacteria)]|uniref:FAD-binding oxidoreductase n=1 Tax=Bosea sp. (in: a-proteobacteria) TaxID=1871050 RepID=UPI0026157893|nr:FAD-binding oxidoreductase [Bosea sp. (in: a-proteobacteria)]MCO5089503.1 FAD-binding oxidoreductase [Bosea sp. (in: a-proteobacteria)]